MSPRTHITPANARNALTFAVNSAKVVQRRTFAAPRPALQVQSILPRTLAPWLLTIIVLSLVALGFEYLDEPVARQAREWRAQGGIVPTFFRAITDLGTSAWILIITGIGGLIISAMRWSAMNRDQIAYWSRLHAQCNFIFFSVAVTGIAANLIKNTIGRARPRHLDTLGPLEFDFARFDSGFASFPSGHSTTFGALCMALALVLPRKWWPWFAAAAVLGGASRVMVGAHYPSDVIMGLYFGAGATLLFARYLSHRLALFKPGPGVIPNMR